MGWLNIDDAGLDLHIGDFAFYSNNADEQEPGCFSVTIPLGVFGALVMGWVQEVGWDWYRLTAEELMVMSFARSQDLLSDIGEPTEEELAELERDLSDLQAYLTGDD